MIQANFAVCPRTANSGLAEREVIDPSILRDLLSRRAERFRTDHGSATDPLGTAHALKLLAAGISSSTEWVRREHD